MNFDDVSRSATQFNVNTRLKNIMFAIDATLEAFGVYYYDNWLQHGEVVDGPNMEKYWVQFTLMYPYEKMPDPMATLRIIKNGGKIKYSKSKYSYADKITSPDDVSDAPDRHVNIKEDIIWLVTIRLPRKYLDKEVGNLDLENSYFKRGENIEDDVDEDFGDNQDQADQSENDEMLAEPDQQFGEDNA